MSDEEGKIVWPDPLPDPDEERQEPWAKPDAPEMDEVWEKIEEKLGDE